ncbi:MAG: TonB-dependent receptor [Bacteroidota bacterium]
MKKYALLILLTSIVVSHSFAQLNGMVVGREDDKLAPIYLAKIQLLNAKTGVITDEKGMFELILPNQLPDIMIISAPGFISDSIEVTKKDRFISMKIELLSDNTLPEVVVEHHRSGNSISRMNTLHVEELNSNELRKAACCNLSESFETNASVDVNITDAVSGAKKIQMMGLDGVYTQIQMENIPYLRGLESSFGLTAIPGTWIESIQITKGTGNVVNGYESMAGLVNLELKKPNEMPKFYLNGYGSIFGRAELNSNFSHVINKKWATSIMAHYAGSFADIDHNHDSFRDLPKGNLFALMNRWHYNGEKMEAQFGINGYWDDKLGGQIASVANRYAVDIKSRHLDAYAKTGFFLKKPATSIGVVYNAKYQEFGARFGNSIFNGTEKRGYINAIYDGYFGSTIHQIKAGISGVFADYQQRLDSLTDNRLEIVPGVFTEYTYNGIRVTSVLGARLDYHNLFGLQFSPRIHSKFLLSEFTTLRLTAGKGWRTPNYMIDNISLLASSNNWIGLSELKPEISWNFGGSLVQNFKLFKSEAQFSVDVYHTRFENQLIVDREQGNITFNNQKGKSYSNAIQTEFKFSPIRNWELRFAYKLLDVKAEYDGVMQQQAFIPRHRGFFTSNYITRNKRWEFNATVSVFGKSRIPDYATELVASKVYPMVGAQITYIYKRFDFYVGGENLANYKQDHPIVDHHNPFGATFDATLIWGPIMGINIYAGFRYTIKKNK